jgi:tRNA-specific 2-thiouridylase
MKKLYLCGKIDTEVLKTSISAARHEELSDKRIAVLLSGGVDSSVVVYELSRLGLHPDCFYIRIGPEESDVATDGADGAKHWDCSSEEDLEMASVVAARYGCRLEVVDCHEDY